MRVNLLTKCRIQGQPIQGQTAAYGLVCQLVSNRIEQDFLCSTGLCQGPQGINTSADQSRGILVRYLGSQVPGLIEAMINFNSIPLRGTEEDGNLGLSSHMSQPRLLILTSEHETKLNEQEEQTEWYSFRCSFFQQCALGAQFLLPQAVQLYGETPLSATGQLLDQSIACALLSQLLYSTGSQSSSYSGPLARPFCSHSLVGAYYRVFPYPYDLVHLNKWIGLPNALPTIVNSQLDRPFGPQRTVLSPFFDPE